EPRQNIKRMEAWVFRSGRGQTLYKL
ncbi:uncharacterized protein METZ01_LOCUS472188, partial [marine metagenome]